MIKKYWHVSVYIAKTFFEHDCANRAASLAYTTLLSIIPLAVFSFWILSLFPIFQGTGQELQAFILDAFVSQAADAISKQIENFLQQTRELSLTNLAALVFVSILMIFDMVSAFNSIWQVKPKRHLILSFGFYFLATLLAPILFGIFMVTTSYLATLPFISDIAHIPFLEGPFLYILPYLATFLIFTFLNWALPSCSVPFRNAVLAGLFTTIAFETVKYFFSLYMTLIPTYRIIYGALAAIPIFLLWVYISWVIVLLGALLCRIMTRKLPRHITT